MQYIRYIYTIYVTYKIYKMYALFSFFRTQTGIESGHSRTLYPDDVIRNTIGHVGSTIYVVNEVLLIYHSLLTLHIYAIYKIYNVHIRYITYKIYNTYIRCMLVFLFSGHPTSY